MKFTIALALILSVGMSHAQTFDIYDSFTTTAPSNGPWKVGFRSGLGGTAFIPFNRYITTYGSGFLPPVGRPEGWTDQSLGGAAFGIWRNPDNFAHANGDVAQTILPARTISAHPEAGGNGGYNPIIRFTAATAGQYKVNLAVGRVSVYPGQTKHSLLLNGQVLDTYTFGSNNYILANRPEQLITMQAGDIIDYEINIGDGSPAADSIAIRSTIQVVPEPATMLVLGAGILALLRRNKIASM